MKRAKIRDVAERAGVSTATVSLALNGNGSRISAATVATVRQAAKDLGYQPNAAARSLRTERTQTLAMISDQIITTPYANRMVLGAQEAAWEREHLLFVVNTNGDPEQEAAYIAALQARNVDGFICASMYHRRGPVPEALRGATVVGMDIELPEPALASFVPDEVGGARAATQTLIEAGHRRIAHITDPEWVPAQGLRLAGFTTTMRAAECWDPSLVRIPERSAVDINQSDWGEHATAELLALPSPPTAIFAYNDRTAIGVYRAARAAGLRIPEDLSVIGFDDQELVATELRPRLTTVALPHRELGRAAAGAVLAAIDPSAREAELERPTTPILVSCPMVHRESVGPPSGHPS